MAILRLLGDFCHLTSILILIYKIHTRKTTAGISLRTRVLYLLVFLSRYGDLFLYYVSFYNTFMKILYLSTTAYIIYLMTINAEFKNTWYHDLDNFAILPLVIASFLLMFICTAKYTMFELSWTFSIILESVAILPQIDHLTKVPTLPALPLSHLVALGMYRGFYVLHWTVTLFSDGFWDFTVFFFGLIQTIIWADFLWVWYNRKQIKLPPNTAGQGIRSEEAGTAEGQQVDESDMSSSFVLTHLIRLARQFEARYRSSRSAPLSVSAYPERGFETQAPQSTGAYVDDLPSAQTASTNDDGAYTIPDPSIQPAKIEVPAVLLGEAEESTSNGAKIWGAQAPGSTTHGTSAQRNKSEDGFSVDSDHEEGSRPGEAAR